MDSVSWEFLILKLLLMFPSAQQSPFYLFHPVIIVKIYSVKAMIPLEIQLEPVAGMDLNFQPAHAFDNPFEAVDR